TLSTSLLIVCGSDEVARVTLSHQLGAQATGIIGQVIKVRVNRDEDLTFMRLALEIFLDYDFANLGSGHGPPLQPHCMPIYVLPYVLSVIWSGSDVPECLRVLETESISQ